MRDFDAVLTGLEDSDASLVWVASCGTPVPEQVFDAEAMRAAGWRQVGRMHGVLYVADQAELDRAIESKRAQVDLEAANAEHDAAAPFMKPGFPEPDADGIYRDEHDTFGTRRGVVYVDEPEPRSAGLTIYDDADPANWDRDQP